MKKVFAVLVVFGLGVALGRLFDGSPRKAEAGGGNPLPPCQDINGDGSSDLSDAIFLLQWRFLDGPAPACPTQNGQPSGLPDIGQTKCYDRGGKEIPCDSATCPGQDARYATGCPQEGRFVDNQDGTVTDNCTGLMWQKETADTNSDGVHNDGDTRPWCEALAHCEDLSFAGHDDWRLPNVRELHSLVDYGRFNPAIDPVFGAFPAPYWSSTSSAGNPGYAWCTLFSAGYVDSDFVGLDKGSGFFVRAVRGGP